MPTRLLIALAMALGAFAVAPVALAHGGHSVTNDAGRSASGFVQHLHH